MGRRDWNRRQQQDDEPNAGAGRAATKKTTVGARERDEAARTDWRGRAETLPARKVVVIDERSTHLDMARGYGRAPRATWTARVCQAAAQLWQEYDLAGWLATGRDDRLAGPLRGSSHPRFL